MTVELGNVFFFERLFCGDMQYVQFALIWKVFYNKHDCSMQSFYSGFKMNDKKNYWFVRKIQLYFLVKMKDDFPIVYKIIKLYKLFHVHFGPIPFAIFLAVA